MMVLSVGDNIDAYCLKCKLVLAHVIMFKVDGAVSRVKCKTCGAEHKYRGATTTEKAKTARSASGVLRAKKTVPSKTMPNDAPLKWDLKSRNMPPDTKMIEYSIRDKFKANDVIHHPVFGVGFVEKVLSDKSISVLFSDSIKLLGMQIPS